MREWRRTEKKGTFFLEVELKSIKNAKGKKPAREEQVNDDDD
jgi:hypothetical protein